MASHEVKTADVLSLKSAIRRHWDREPSPKAKRYIGAFFDRVRLGTKIAAKVVGNHGTYAVSIELKGDGIAAACSCYIGKGGGCHHCAALGLTFVEESDSFVEQQAQSREAIQSLDDVRRYLREVTLDELMAQLKTRGLTQKAFAESIGMNPNHLSAVKSSERRNRYFHELGAIKLACLWMLEHMASTR